jgi:uncharacterized membrane protein
MDKNYDSPSIEVVEVEVEQGFASSSVDSSVDGITNDFTSGGFGPGAGGRTMDF